MPYFWVDRAEHGRDPHAEIPVAQGLLGDIEFRHRLDNGYYYIEATGIHQHDDSAFAAQPWGAGGQTDRGDRPPRARSG